RPAHLRPARRLSVLIPISLVSPLGPRMRLLFDLLYARVAGGCEKPAAFTTAKLPPPRERQADSWTPFHKAHWAQLSPRPLLRKKHTANTTSSRRWLVPSPAWRRIWTY